MLHFRKASIEILLKEFFKVSLQAKLLKIPTTTQAGGEKRIEYCQLQSVCF